MPNRTAATLAMLCAAPALAQGTVHIHFDADLESPYAGDTNTWTVTATFEGYDDPTAYFGGFVGDFIGTSNPYTTVTGYENLMQGEGTAPKVLDDSIFQINIFNAALIGTNDSSNPIDIFRFTTLNSDLVRDPLTFDAVGVASVFATDGIFTIPDEFTDFTVTSDTIWWVPAPSGTAALALAGLAAARRRR